jgi:hypothetical protein
MVNHICPNLPRSLADLTVAFLAFDDPLFPTAAIEAYQWLDPDLWRARTSFASRRKSPVKKSLGAEIPLFVIPGSRVHPRPGMTKMALL